VEVTTASKEPEQVWQTRDGDLRNNTKMTSAGPERQLFPSFAARSRGVDGGTDSISDHVGCWVRGFGGEFSNRFWCSIDGRSVYSPLFAGVYWQVQDTLLEDVDRIEVIRGPGGTIWGANAVNGIINIITRNAKRHSWDTVSLGWRECRPGIGGFRYGSSARGVDYRVYGKGFIRGPEFHPDGVNFDDWRMGQVGFRHGLV